jgi:ABC-type glycerol-3-phosphate transport system substrate-binding protein
MIMALRGKGLACVLIALAAVSGLSACGSSGPASASSGLSCSNYALHGTGQYHNEESVRVQVSNSTAHAALYAVDVTLTGSSGGQAKSFSTLVTVSGAVASHQSGLLGRKVLTTGPVQRCRVTRITSQSGS